MKKYIHKDFDHYYRVYDESSLYGLMTECIDKGANTRQTFNQEEHTKFISALERAGWYVG